jgi:Ca2+-binding RTX toxin-like protein
VTTVNHTGGTAVDGIDTLTGIERLQFTDQVVSTVPNQPPAAGATLINLGPNATLGGNPARLTPQEAIPVSVNTAAITDTNGINPGTVFTFQWRSRAAGSTLAPTNIAGATAATFTPPQAQVGRVLSVVVSFTDAAGNAETVTSADTLPVGDLFAGTANADTFNGNAGEDLARGVAGNDILNGVAGNDVLVGGLGNDTINAGSGTDVIQYTGTNEGADTVDGQADVDRIEATANGTLIGLTSVVGVEQITGGTFTGVRVVGSANADTLNLNTVTLTNIVNVDGGAGNDTLSLPDSNNVVLGGDGADSILGRGGDDNIDGGLANDTMNGGPGNDTVSVSAGNDTVVFDPTFGNDVILGFDGNGGLNQQDFFNISALGVTAANFNARVTIAATATPAAGSTLITIRNGAGAVTGTITTSGISPVNITAADFILAP